jgi:hypothetical protein
MPSATIHEQMPVPAAQVFNLLHDYSRRLEWDTLLCEARLTRGHTQAGPEATSLCVGRPWFGLIGIETRYIAFKPAEIAAVEMINHPPFFGSFAASIRHQDNAHGSTITYKFNFTARPRWLRWILHPVMLWQLQRETRRRLRALAAFLALSTRGTDDKN